MKLAVDLSNYSGPISNQQARDLVNAGVSRAIVQAVRPDIRVHEQQIPNLIAAGIEVQGYVYVWYSAGEQFIRDRVAWACSEFKRWPQITFVWADCEQADDTGFNYAHADHDQVVQLTAAALDTIGQAGFETGIYTARWWWVPATGDSHYFSGVFPLWNANYDGDPDIDPAGYGGWDIPRMEQYQGSSTIAGVPMVDLDSYNPPKPPVDIRLVQARDLINAVIAEQG